MPRKAENLRVPRSQPPSYDADAVDQLIDEAFDREGWLLTENGEVAHDHDTARHAMFTAMTTNHAVTSVSVGRSRKTFADLVQERAATKYGLYCEVFPHGPAAAGPPQSEEEQAAKDVIANALWRWSTTTSRSGWLQKELGDSGLVVLEAKVYSLDPAVPTQIGRYVTDVESALLDFLETKVIADVQKKIGEADAWLATLMSRNSNIALPAAKKARALMRSALDNAMHANPTFVRETLFALPTASESDSTDDVVDDEFVADDDAVIASS